MSDFDYMNRTYSTDFKKGDRVKTYSGRLGEITGSDGQYLRIRLDGEEFERDFHPTWELTKEAQGNES